MYTKYTGYKCTDCDYVADTVEDVNAHIAKKHKNATSVDDFVKKRFLLEETDDHIEFTFVNEFCRDCDSFCITTYTFYIKENEIYRFAKTTYAPVDVVIKYNHAISHEYVENKIKEMAKKCYMNCLDAYVDSCVKGTNNFIAPKHR